MKHVSWVHIPIGLATVLVALLGLWPTYGTADRFWLPAAGAAAVSTADQLDSTEGATEALSAGWGGWNMDLPPGTPLAGYGDRRGRPAEGKLDGLAVGAVALSDGKETALLFSGDLLVITPNIAAEVRAVVSAETGLDPRGIYFTATHTHGGPGGAMPGLVARAFGGKYRKPIAEAIVSAFAHAARNAVADFGPAEVSVISIPLPELVRNRVRDASQTGPLVDDVAQALVVRRLDVERQAVVLRYSAHATVIGADTFEPTAGYPGEAASGLGRLLLAEASDQQICSLLPVLETSVFFVAGAVGSMGPRPPSGPDDRARAAAMGMELARRVADALPMADFVGYRSEVDIRYAGVALRLPPLQLRVAPGIRISPLALQAAGLTREGWFSVLDIGSALFMGFPGDLSGELAAAWRTGGAGRPVVLTSFNGAYAGYLSPDAYYRELYDGDDLAYETGIMSWTGPRQEAYMHRLYTAGLEATSGR